MKVNIIKDIRTLKQGEVYELDFTQANPLIIVGPNGCGKSTLVNAIRGTLNSNKKTDSLYNSEIKELGECVSIEHDYDNIYHLSAQIDNPMDMNNTFDASAFVDMGGFYAAHLSSGQISVMMLNKFIKELNSKPEGNTLIILDESDKGMDLATQKTFTSMIAAMVVKFGADVLVITHTTLPILFQDKVYDFKNKEYISPEEYCKRQINHQILIV